MFASDFEPILLHSISSNPDILWSFWDLVLHNRDKIIKVVDIAHSTLNIPRHSTETFHSIIVFYCINKTGFQYVAYIVLNAGFTSDDLTYKGYSYQRYADFFDALNRAGIPISTLAVSFLPPPPDELSYKTLSTWWEKICNLIGEF